MKNRKGNQIPRIDQFVDGDIWLAEKTIALLEYYGNELLPWQKLVLRRWMALDENGKYANPEAGLSVPRQNGKTELLIYRIIGGIIFNGDQILYTAHTVKTTNEIKRRVLNFFYKAEAELRNMLTDEFDKMPKSLDYIELRNGARCIFNTRTRTAGLGYTNDILLVDEAAEFSDSQQEALVPTLSAGRNQNHQIIMATMPPTTGSGGTVFARTRDKVIKGKAHNYCWQEWGVEFLTDPNNEDAWYESNPSLGYFLLKKAIQNESVTMSIDSFNKMRLGWYVGVESQRAISDKQWTPLAVKKVDLPKNYQRVYAVKFAPDRSAVSLAVGVPIGSKIHIELLERKALTSGIGWLVQWLLQRWKLASKIIIDGAAGAPLLIEELYRSERRIGKIILAPTIKDVGAAYGAFQLAVENKELTHYDQPLLNSSIKTVKKRDIGRDGRFGYAGMGELAADPVEAVAFAYYGAKIYCNDKIIKKSQQRILV